MITLQVIDARDPLERRMDAAQHREVMRSGIPADHAPRYTAIVYRDGAAVARLEGITPYGVGHSVSDRRSLTPAEQNLPLGRFYPGQFSSGGVLCLGSEDIYWVNHSGPGGIHAMDAEEDRAKWIPSAEAVRAAATAPTTGEVMVLPAARLADLIARSEVDHMRVQHVSSAEEVAIYAGVSYWIGAVTAWAAPPRRRNHITEDGWPHTAFLGHLAPGAMALELSRGDFCGWSGTLYLVALEER